MNKIKITCRVIAIFALIVLAITNLGFYDFPPEHMEAVEKSIGKNSKFKTSISIEQRYTNDRSFSVYSVKYFVIKTRTIHSFISIYENDKFVRVVISSSSMEGLVIMFILVISLIIVTEYGLSCYLKLRKKDK